jgi:dephospho-CoA kinase
MDMIGLTGGIGSGKSTIAAVLKELGATVIDADEAARAVVEPGTTGFDLVVERFGPDFVRGERIDREKLGNVVFHDADARRSLNEIVHPLVREWMAQRQTEAAAAGERRVVLEIPLLYEGGLQAAMKKVILVHVPPEVQVRRLVADRGLDEEQARARIASQMSIDEKARLADYVIDNSGSRAEARTQAEAAWGEITSAP